MAGPTTQSKPLAVISGGAGQLALTCAERLYGWRVLLSDRRADGMDAAAARLAEKGIEATTHVADITRRQDAEALAAAAAEMGEFGALLHTAGVAPPTAPEVIYAVNLFGTINLLEAFEPLVQPGVVGVCVASIAGHRQAARRWDDLLADPNDDPASLAERIEAAAPGLSKPRLAYAASKRGAILQVERRAHAWGRRGGRLLSVSPGVVADTAMGLQRQAAQGDKGEASPRLVNSAEIADAVAFAVWPGATGLNGVDLLVDAGYLAAVNHQFDPVRRTQWHAIEI